MSIGHRIKKIRKELDLTQQKFGERLGVKGNTIAQYELGRSNPVDSVISLIIREFNINEEWLRTGEGEMFKPAPSDALEQLAAEYNLSNASTIIVEKFVKLKPEKRNEVLSFLLDVSEALINSDIELKSLASEPNNNENLENSIIQAFDKAPKTPSDLEKLFPPVEPPKRNTETG